jgi:hypothetical protein
MLPLETNRAMTFTSTQVPICLAGTDTDEFLTAEPAVVVQEEGDEQLERGDQSSGSHYPSDSPIQDEMVPGLIPFADRRKTQHGVTLRRAVHKLSAMRKRTSSIDSDIFDHMNSEEKSGVSPFERSMSSRDINENSLRSRTPSADASRARSMRSLSTLDKSASQEMSWRSRSSAIMAELKGLSESKGEASSGKDE